MAISLSVGRLNPKDFYFLYVGSLGMCGQTQIVFRSTLSGNANR